MDKIKYIENRIFLQNLFLLFLFGTILNISVVVFNGGKMPILLKATENLPQDFQDSYLVVEDKEDINYYFLGDIFNIKRLYFSIGDILMVCGILGILIILTHGFFIKIERRSSNGNSINNK